MRTTIERAAAPPSSQRPRASRTRGRVGRFVAACAALGVVGALLAPPTSLAATADNYITHCATCHSKSTVVMGKTVYDDSPTFQPRAFNGAGSVAVIKNAFANSPSMKGQTVPSDPVLADIALYLQGLVLTIDAGKTDFQMDKSGIALGEGQQVFLGTTASAFEVFELGATAPTRGKVTFQGSTATYKPDSGQAGSDQFTVKAVNKTTTKLSSSERTVNIAINGPGAPNAPDATVDNVPVNSGGVEIAVEVTGGYKNKISVPSASEGIKGSDNIVRGKGTVTLLSAPAATTVRFRYKPPPDGFGIDHFNYTATADVPGGESKTGTITIVVPPLPPKAGALAMTVPLNTTKTLDLKPFITGSAISGIRISTRPAHGTATMNGTVVAYTPRRDYFGPDSFAYAAFGIVGESAPNTVTVTVVGRPDPSLDPDVVGLIAAQVSAARRFSKTQILNFQRRLEALHRSGGAPAPADSSPTLAATTATDGDATGRALQLASAAPNSSPGGAAAGPATPLGLIGTAVGIARSHAVNLSSVGALSGNDASGDSPVGVWAEGSVDFGKHRGSGINFTTNGVTLGIDRRLGERVALGIGLGYAHDETDVGSAGTRSRTQGSVVAAYGSYRPLPDTFIDAVAGYGTLDFRTTRFVAPIDDIARAERHGDHVFGSISAAREYRVNRFLLAPYGRLDLATARLKQATESGAGSYALTYMEQTVRTAQLALGLRAESAHETESGFVLPHLRLEYQRDLERDREAALTYADQPSGQRYLVSPAMAGRDALRLALGADFVSRGGLSLGIDYQLQRSSRGETQQAVRLLLASELGGRGASPALSALSQGSARPFDVQVSTGFMHDDNVTRGKDAQDRLSDDSFRLTVGTDRVVRLNDFAQAVLRGSVGAESWRRYTRLARVFGEVQGELRYRASGDFDTPTFAAFARVAADEYRDALRDGYRYAAGASVQQALTDRIDMLATLAHNVRNARSAVFDLVDNSLRLRVDYRTGPAGIVYLGGEYRRGDVVSTGVASLDNLDIAEVFVADDAFPGRERFSYRFDARTDIVQLGWNWRLGADHSVDLSWTRSRSVPSGRPSFVAAPSNRYIVGQVRAVYLLRF